MGRELRGGTGGRIGKLNAHSRSMNESIHTVSSESQEEPVSGAMNPEQSDPSSGAKTVLLAEDEPVVREFMASAIREVGYNVLQAENGEQALRLFEDSDGQRIDLLLTDIVMPVMGGKELAYRVGSLVPETKIVFCSAYPEKLVVSNGTFDKQIPFLQKPVSVDALKLKVREILGDAEQDLQLSSADIGALPQRCFEEPHWASLSVVLLVISADLIVAAILLLAILHRLR